MKYIVILGDGMADYPVPELGNKTPLQRANKPIIDDLARHGSLGLVRTVPEETSPGSDTANMSVLGFDPRKYYTGRSPIEAISMGIALDKSDVAFRCNLVTLSNDGENSDNFEDKIMIDYSSDEISSEESHELICAINERFCIDGIKFYPGISYRHCMVCNGRGLTSNNTPPHDILERRIGDYLPYDKSDPAHAETLNRIMRESFDLLSKHPVNIARIKRGLRPANSVWLWGQGTRMELPSFEEKYGVKGVVISAVDLIKGIGICCGLKPIEVEGATGTIDTNYEGKANAAINALNDGADFAYVHVEAPDECGHRNEIENKVRSIELIDSRIMPIIIDGLKAFDDYSILVLPDHPTPLSLRTHTRDPVPFAVYTKSKRRLNSKVTGYDEIEAKKTGLYIDVGHTLMESFIRPSPIS